MRLGADGSAYVVGTVGIDAGEESAMTARIRPGGTLAWMDLQPGEVGGNGYGVDVGPNGAVFVAAEAFFISSQNDFLTLRYEPELIGDLNCDGLVSVGDIGAFVLALTEPDQYVMMFPDCALTAGDCSGDGIVSVGDIGCFVATLTGS